MSIQITSQAGRDAIWGTLGGRPAARGASFRNRRSAATGDEAQSDPSTFVGSCARSRVPSLGGL
jgi:hypothetical protein